MSTIIPPPPGSPAAKLFPALLNADLLRDPEGWADRQVPIILADVRRAVVGAPRRT